MKKEVQLKQGWVISTASGWYWSSYSKENRLNEELNIRYTIFDTEGEALLEIPNAIDNMNGRHLMINKIYYFPGIRQ